MAECGIAVRSYFFEDDVADPTSEFGTARWGYVDFVETE